MSKERLIELAEQSGLPTALDYHQKRYEKFAELVRADERNSWPAEMEAMERQVNILTDALAEQQEPVAWVEGEEIYWHNAPDLNDWIRQNGQPLCTTPPQRKPLTDEQIHEMANDFEEGYVFLYRSFARAIEAAHGIKEKS